MKYRKYRPGQCDECRFNGTYVYPMSQGGLTVPSCSFLAEKTDAMKDILVLKGASFKVCRDAEPPK